MTKILIKIINSKLDTFLASLMLTFPCISDARHLVSFSIDIYPNSILQDAYLTGSIQCAYYPVGSYIAPGTTEKFVCIAPNYGRYLIVRKVKNFGSTPEYLSFAEITIYYKWHVKVAVWTLKSFTFDFCFNLRKITYLFMQK